MFPHKCTTLAAALALSVSMAAVAAQTSKSTKGHAHMAIRGADLSFVKEAAAGGQEEVSLGNLASTKGSSQAVKDFGSRMVKDHTKANEELSSIASKQGLTLPSQLPSKQKSEVSRFEKLSGAAFDKAYARMMVQDHEHDVAAFEKESKSGKDAEVRSFASSTLPTLEEHLSMARKMNSEVNRKGGAHRSSKRGSAHTAR